MKKRSAWVLVILWTLGFLSVQGCATTTNHIPLQRDTASLSPLKVAYYGEPFPKMNAHHLGLRIACWPFIIIPPIGLTLGLLGAGWESGMEKDIANAKMPDIRELVARKFVDRAAREIINWPKMDLQEGLINDQYIKSYFQEKFGNLMLIELPRSGSPGDWGERYEWHLSTSDGFNALIHVTIKDSEGNIVWLRDVSYISGKYKRERSVEEFKANNFKLLREEIDFAADIMVSEMIKTISNDISVAKKNSP
jgi:hypothetical protein